MQELYYYCVTLASLDVIRIDMKETRTIYADGENLLWIENKEVPQKEINVIERDSLVNKVRKLTRNEAVDLFGLSAVETMEAPKIY